MSHNSAAGSGPTRVRRRRRLLIAGVVGVVLLLVLGYGSYRLTSSRSTQVAGKLIKRVDTTEKVVALTFDDGPTDADADTVLRVLAERRVSATFYVNGAGVAANGATTRRIVEAGHELGNHTWSHRRMVFVSPATVAREIEPTDQVIRATGYRGPLTFRPPNGKKLVTLPVYLAQHDRTTVTWDVSAEDFSGRPQTSAEIVRGTVQNTRPGSIILLHPWFGRSASQQAIGPVIDQLRAQGYRFVTVSELIR